MNNREINVLEQYPLKIYHTYKGRGSIICETDQGLKLLKEYKGSKERAQFQFDVLCFIKKQGIIQVDCFVKNKEDSIFSTTYDENVFVLKDWFEGKECDVQNKEDIKESVKQLALLHKCMDECQVEIPEFLVSGDDFFENEFEKHNKELKKIKNFIRNKKKKGNFDFIFLKNYEGFYQQGIQCVENIRTICCKEDLKNKKRICHGDFTQHNILNCKRGVAITNFEQMYGNNPMTDFYQFFRKMMEKHNWNIDLAKEMVQYYTNERRMTDQDIWNLFFLLSYPEKFWKIANHYYNTNKAWISEKNVEKMEALTVQDTVRREFLDKFDYFFL